MLRRVLAVLALTTLVFAAGCSDDDNGDGATSASSSSTSSTVATTTTVKSLAADEIDAKASPYCATWADIRGAAGEDISGADEAAVKKHYARLVPLTERLLEQAPDELKGDIRKVLDATQQAAETGSTNSFAGPEMSDIGERLAQYALDHCRK